MDYALWSGSSRMVQVSGRMDFFGTVSYGQHEIDVTRRERSRAQSLLLLSLPGCAGPLRPTEMRQATDLLKSPFAWNHCSRQHNQET